MRLLNVADGSSTAKVRGIVAAFPDIWSGRVMDVGCRDQELRSALEGRSVSYLALDVGKSGHVMTDLGAGLPFRSHAADVVVALDVLEHTDDIHHSFDELCRVADRNIVISLPNFYDVRVRLRHLRGRPLGGKWGLPLEPPSDRHRWLFSLGEARRFCRERAKKEGWDLADELVIAGPRRQHGLGRWLLRARPSAFSSTYVTLLRREGR